MRATFDMLWPNHGGNSRVVVVLTPENADEARLLELWMRYPENAFNVSVTRRETKAIESIVVDAQQS